MAKFKITTEIEILIEREDKEDAENYISVLLDNKKWKDGEIKDFNIIEVFAEETNEEEL